MKLVILGVDSTHTEAFSEAIANSTLLAPRAQIVGLWGENQTQAQEKAQKLGIPRVFYTVREAIQASDGVLVLGRFPESHFEPSLETLRARKPLYVDKPFVLKTDEINTLVSLAQSSGAPLMSCSVYRFAPEVQRLVKSNSLDKHATFMMSGPRECNDLGKDPRFQDISFYGIHLVEIMLALLGHDILDFKVSQTSKATIGTASFLDGRQCTLQFLSGIPSEAYHFMGFDGHQWIPHQIQYEASMYEKLILSILDHMEGKTDPWSIQSNRIASQIIACLKGAHWNA